MLLPCTAVQLGMLLGGRRHMTLTFTKTGQNAFTYFRVPTGQGKLEKFREFQWSGKVWENAKVTGKSGKCWENFSRLVQLL